MSWNQLSFKEYRKEKYKQLLDDVDVKRWISNLSKGSVILADVYLRALGRFCERVKTTPQQFAKMPLKKMEDVTQDFIDEMESTKQPSGEHYSPGYIESYLKAVRSWAEWNRKPLQRKIKISNPNRRPTLKDERAPTQEELKKVLYNDKTPLRTRACIALIAFSGVRIEVLGDYRGLDGLRIKDLHDIEIADGKINIKKVPSMIVVREDLSKSRHKYLSFLCEEGCEILKQYLERRLQEGETLIPESGIIVTSISQARKSSHFNIEDKSPFLRTTKVGDEIRRAMRIAALPWRPYVFRTYFDTTLMLAESKGFVSHAYQQFWMGHKGDIEAQYTTNKTHLPDKVIEDMRQSYGKIQPLLQTTKHDTTSEDLITQQIRRQFLSMSGYSEEEITRMDPDSMTPEDINLKVKERMLGAMLNNGSKQKVITLSEVENLIGQGWEYVDTIGDKAIMKIPT